MEVLRKIRRVSWTAKKNKKTNEWVLNKAGVKKELLDTVKARKLAYYGHTMRKQGSWLEKEIMQGTMPGARRRGRPCMAWIDNIKTWTELPLEELIRMTEDRDRWPTFGPRTAKRIIINWLRIVMSACSIICQFFCNDFLQWGHTNPIFKKNCTPVSCRNWVHNAMVC